MAEYVASWSVFVTADNPVSAARRAREMADEHFRCMWGITDLDSFEEFTVDLELGEICEIEQISEEDESVEIEGENA